MKLLQLDSSASAAVVPIGPAAPRRQGREEELQEQMACLIPRMRIAVIYGGDKDEDGAVINTTMNTRSWKSYKSVAENIADSLKSLGCPNVFLMPDDMRLGERLKEQCIDFAWLNTGGVQGYSPVSHGPAMLELFGIPYVGHDPLHAAILDSKHAFKRELLALEIPTAHFVTWHSGLGPFDPYGSRRYKKFFEGNKGPFVVKPVSGRASLHVHFVERVQDLAYIVGTIFDATENHVMVEQFLGGPEYCIAVSGYVTAKGGIFTRHDEPFAFGAVERVLAKDEHIFTSMDIQSITQDRVRVLDPKIEKDTIAKLNELAQEVYCELSLESLVRLDVRSDLDGNVFVLEANPKPDLKKPFGEETSLICEGLAQQNMSYDDLILSMLADRIDLLFNQRRGMVTHLLSLLGDMSKGGS